MATTSTPTNAAPLPRMLSARDLTQILGSRAMAYRLFAVEGFPKVSLGKRVLVREDAFIQWWAEHEGASIQLEKQA